MFDTIFCEYKLPNISLEGTSLTQKDIQYHDYQSKDLDCTLENYTIEEDRRISYTQYNKTEWVEVPSDKLLGGYIDRKDPETVYLSGNHVFSMYAYVQSEEDPNDYQWEWEVTVLDGKVDTVYLEKFEKTPNEERKVSRAHWKAKMKERERFMKTIGYRYFWKWVERVRWFLRGQLISVLQWALNWAYKI